MPGAEQRLGGGWALPCAMGGGPRGRDYRAFRQSLPLLLHLSLPEHLAASSPPVIACPPLPLEVGREAQRGSLRGEEGQEGAGLVEAGRAGRAWGCCLPTPFPPVTCLAAVGHSPSSQAPGLLAWLPAPLPPFPSSVQCGGEVWRVDKGDQGGVGLA